MNTIPNFKEFEKNIADVIKEEQIKLGYRKENIRLYYPRESINHLLQGDYSEQELREILDQFADYVKERLGKLTHSHKESRYCIFIPEEGVEYVHDKIADSPFLEEFINRINQHPCSLEDILGVFHRHSGDVICEKTQHGEFDYLIYFKEQLPDSYLYCLKFEHGHAIYHRFTKSDYDSFGFEE